jgi:hypothetical protein
VPVRKRRNVNLSKLGAKETVKRRWPETTAPLFDTQNLLLVIVITSLPNNNRKHDGSLEYTVEVTQTTQSPYRMRCSGESNLRSRLTRDTIQPEAVTDQHGKGLENQTA